MQVGACCSEQWWSGWKSSRIPLRTCCATHAAGTALSLCSFGLCSLGAMTTVLLIRHGRTSANTAGVLVGRTSGVGLDATGVQQAAEMATRLTGVHLRAIVTSPLRRCRQTRSEEHTSELQSLAYPV